MVLNSIIADFDLYEYNDHDTTGNGITGSLIWTSSGKEKNVCKIA